MKLFGINIIQLLGLVNFGLLLFQVLTGYGKIRVPFTVHRKTGTALFVTALVHGLLGFLSHL